jgi:prepilin-type N-terminal cleavage/methylation domain-containing protein
VFPRGISGPTFAALRRVEQRRSGGCCSRSRFPQRVAAHPPDHRSPITRLRCATARRADHSVRAGFTLLELLVVIGIVALLMVLVAPAFTNLKSAGDMNNAAYTIKGVLDTARTYAKANNTYTWVGFYEENGSNPSSPNPDTPAVGRIIVSVVASKDGTMMYTAPLTGLVTLTPANLIHVGKVSKIDSLHLKICRCDGHNASRHVRFATCGRLNRCKDRR